MTLKLRPAALALAACATLVGTLPALAADAASDTRSALPRYVAGELLLKFRPGQAALVREQTVQALGARTARVLKGVLDSATREGELHLVKLPANKTVEAAMRQLRGNPAVEFAEPNFTQSIQGAPNDPYYADGRLWGYYGATSPGQQNAFGSGAAQAFDAGRRCSADVIVGIIDEGVMNTHPDTRRNIWVNPFEVAGNGVDDDGNGFVDDVTGWDHLNDDATTFDGATDDHGTHVSGTIGAIADNGIGTAGVCDSVKMISSKFLEGSGSTADAIAAVDYITDLKVRHGLNIVATNNSWGGGEYSQALRQAIQRAGKADILFVASAGNGNLIGRGLNTDSKPSYPAAYPSPNIVSVAALTSSGAKAGYSNYGLRTVDIAAPGSDIWSTVPTSTGAPGYASYSGTSMASPHVTGGIALYKSLHPDATAQQILRALRDSAVPTAAMAGKSVTGGRLDVSGF